MLFSILVFVGGADKGLVFEIFVFETGALGLVVFKGTTLFSFESVVFGLWFTSLILLEPTDSYIELLFELILEELIEFLPP